VRDVSWSAAARTLALVGESGCGKSLTALSVMVCCRRASDDHERPSRSTAPT
jgi:ABC-type dipeptide/oligopeptide/nickel transport system ATPase component